MLSHLHSCSHGWAGAAAWSETGRNIKEPRANKAGGGTISKQGSYRRGDPRPWSACGTCWTSPYRSLCGSNRQAVQAVLKGMAQSRLRCSTTFAMFAQLQKMQNGFQRPTHGFVQHGGDKVVSNSLYLITAFAMVIWMDQERTLRVHSNNLRQQTFFEILEELFYSLNHLYIKGFGILPSQLDTSPLTSERHQSACRLCQFQPRTCPIYLKEKAHFHFHFSLEALNVS